MIPNDCFIRSVGRVSTKMQDAGMTHSGCVSCVGTSLALRCFSSPGKFAQHVSFFSHMQISDVDKRMFGIEKKTLDEIRKEMVNHKQQELQSALQYLRTLEAMNDSIHASTCCCRCCIALLLTAMYRSQVFAVVQKRRPKHSKLN